MKLNCKLINNGNRVAILCLAITTCLLLAPISSSYAWWGNSNSYSSQDTSYDGRSYSLNEFRSMKGYEAPKVEVKSSFWSNVGNFFSKIGSAISTTISKTWDFAKNIATSIKEFFVKTPEIEQADVNTKVDTAIDMNTGVDSNSNGFIESEQEQKKVLVEDASVVAESKSEQTEFSNVEIGKAEDLVVDEIVEVGKIAEAVQTGVDPVKQVEPIISGISPAQNEQVIKALQKNKIKLNAFKAMPDSTKQMFIQMVLSQTSSGYSKREEYYSSSKFLDSTSLRPYFGDNQRVVKSKAMDKVKTDFKNHTDFQPNMGRHVEAVSDVGTRGVKIAISTATGNTVGKATASAVGTVTSAVIGDVLDSVNPSASVTQNDRMVFAEVANKFESYVDAMVIPKMTFEVNPITHAEAINRNNDDRKVSFFGGMIPFYGNILSAIKTQPFSYGQVEYKVTATVDREVGPNVFLEYRTGKFENDSGQIEEGVIDAKFIVQERVGAFEWSNKEFEYAPK